MTSFAFYKLGGSIGTAQKKILCRLRMEVYDKHTKIKLKIHTRGVLRPACKISLLIISLSPQREYQGRPQVARALPSPLA
jgi:hypothetical protein